MSLISNPVTRVSKGRLSKRAKLLVTVTTGALVLGCPAAFSQTEIDQAQTAPIATSNQGGGDATVSTTANGTVTVTDGTAVTLDSDTNLTLGGNVEVGASDDSVGVEILPGFTGSFTLDSNIRMDESDDQETALSNGEIPDYNDNRTGLLLSSGGTFTGDITLNDTGSITMFGDTSFGVNILGDLDGSMQVDSDIVVRGEGSTALQIAGDVTGDVIIGSTSSITVDGVNSSAVSISGDISGALVHGGTVFVTGYQSQTQSTDDDANAVQAGQQAGAAFVVSGSVDGGFLVNGPIPSAFTPTVADGEDEFVNPSSAAITASSGSPAVLLSGATLGLVDTSALTDAATYGSFGFINRGSLSGQGVYDGVAALGVVIDNTTIAGGMRNDNTIRSSSSAAASTALTISGTSDVPTLVNGGIISATTIGSIVDETDPDNPVLVTSDTVGLLIDAGANVNSVENLVSIQAAVSSDSANAIAVRDVSGSVTSFTNRGTISAQIIDDVTDGNADTDPIGEAIAYDFTANTTGIAILNTVSSDFDPAESNRANFGNVFGDVRLGAGDDSYTADAGRTTGNLDMGAGNDTIDLSQAAEIIGNVSLQDGDDVLNISNATVTGDLAFGNGADQFNLSDNAVFTGDISDLDGALDVSILTGAALNFDAISAVNLANLTIDNTGVLGVAVENQNAQKTTLLNVANLVNIADGASINPIILGEVPAGSFTSTIISAGTLNVDPASVLIGDADGDVPFLFDFSLAQVGTDLNLQVTRKEAGALGLATSLEAAIDPTIEALNQDLELGTLIFNLKTQEDFAGAFGQLLSGPLDAPLAFARAQNNTVTSIISQRLDMARNSGEYGRTFWLQEETYFVNRDSDLASNGFDGGGFSIATGVDIGLDDTLDAIGLSASFSSARYDEQTGEDFPFNRVTYGVGAYGAASFGNVQVDARAGYSFTNSDSERNVVLGSVRRKAVGEWDGSQVAASGRISYEADVSGYVFEPFLGIDYLSIKEDAYTETGGGAGVDLSAEEREADSLRTNVGFKAGKVFDITPSAYDTGIPATLHPQFSLAWSQELITDPIEATYAYATGGNSFTLASDPEDGAAIIGADVAYENEYAKVHVGASGTFGDTTEAYILRAGVGLKW